MSAIWYQDESQLEVINAAKEILANQYGQETTTPVLPLETFYNAEDYHQKYGLQSHRVLMQWFNAIYPDFKSFVDSTAAARLNGIVSGRGNIHLKEDEIRAYGIPREELNSLLRR